MSNQDVSVLISLVSLGLTLVMSLASLVAVVRILHRTGYSGWWILTTMVPVLNVVMLWIYSRAAWPALSADGWTQPAPARAQAPRAAPVRGTAPQRGPVTVASAASRVSGRPDDHVF